MTIEGHVYIQAGREGVASYHFTPSVHEAYISYRAAPSTWLLDDGSRPPSQKYFISPQYDNNTRIFTGNIYWEDATFNGDKVWEYRMIFSEDFCSIESGSCLAYGSEQEINAEHIYERDLVYRRLR